ncbi:MAG: hypothetical protein H0T51_25890, partial [Pirellulales bacterium]|nr:hypothetical protein [Pirellulales bacterium]
MSRQTKRRRHGKVLVLIAASLPVLLGIVGFVVDGGFIASNQRRLQQAADAAATEAAMALMQGDGAAQAIAIAENSIHVRNEFPTAIVTVHTPPVEGDYAGQAGYVHVRASLPSRVSLMHVLDGVLSRTVRASAVAASLDATDGAAIVVLEDDPASPSMTGLDQILATWNVTSL